MQTVATWPPPALKRAPQPQGTGQRTSVVGRVTRMPPKRLTPRDLRRRRRRE